MSRSWSDKTPDAMKVAASFLFTAGHHLQCRSRPLESTDWSYMLGCTPFLVLCVCVCVCVCVCKCVRAWCI